MPDSKDKKSRFGLFGHKDRPTPTTDSTYGSENSSDAHNSYQSAPSMTGSDNTGTTINDQGQTVTTTTTTTTTTTSGGGGASTTSGPHTSNLANRLDPRVNSSSDQTEVSETVQRREIDRPNIPPKSMRRDPSPNPPSQQRSGGGGGLSSILSGGRHHEQRQPEHHGNQNQPQQQPSGGGGLSSTLSGRRSHDQRQPDNYGSSNAPPQQQSSGAGGLSSILTGGRNHDQGQADNYGSPSSPQGRHNFSYPSRTPPNERAPMQAQGQEQVPVPQQHPSTLQNLKTAAVGIHVSSPILL